MTISFPNIPANIISKDEIEVGGRKYKVLFDSGMPGAYIVIGPPEGLVDTLGLPESFATRLHNILFERRIFSYKDISNTRTAVGILQEVLQLDVQRLTEAFYQYDKETL